MTSRLKGYLPDINKKRMNDVKEMCERRLVSECNRRIERHADKVPSEFLNIEFVSIVKQVVSNNINKRLYKEHTPRPNKTKERNK